MYCVIFSFLNITSHSFKCTINVDLYWFIQNDTPPFFDSGMEFSELNRTFVMVGKLIVDVIVEAIFRCGKATF